MVYSFANITAVNGVDYNCTTQSCFGTLVFAPGQTSPNDPGGDPQRRRRRTLESFNVMLSSPTGGTITRGVDHLCIVDNDAAVGAPQAVRAGRHR